MTCPHCNQPDVRRSRSSHWTDVFQNLLGRQAYRCRKCRQRFFASAFLQGAIPAAKDPAQKRGGPKPIDFRKRKRIARRLITVAVFVAMFSLFGLFLHHLTVDHPPQSHAEDMNDPNE